MTSGVGGDSSNNDVYFSKLPPEPSRNFIQKAWGWLVDNLHLSSKWDFASNNTLKARSWCVQAGSAAENKAWAKVYCCVFQAIKAAPLYEKARENLEIAASHLPEIEPKELQDFYALALQAHHDKKENAPDLCLRFFQELKKSVGDTPWKSFLKESDHSWLKDCKDDLSSLYETMNFLPDTDEKKALIPFMKNKF